ncbi:response regulator transcription factor [Candidatus Bandiella euplotis]|uniref:DNA-binding response regulator n=1 Tax=Candidatus Bandiella euplotis TaxID=1664265 RepID=A0ABZ0UKF9_9RICK|nr:response regulator transcription factor [Candidatus Bandiella woodruffii]WPX96609.1 Putative DNA-binding response regulator [Candidatus Bandiella woodruffii]
MLYHILIVDDDDEIRELLSEYLQRHEYAVSVASDTKAAEALIDTFQFDVIILDVLMPGETGVEFLKRRNNLKTPVIMLTALGDVDDRINGLESGAEDYMAKPFEPKELLVRVKKLIARFQNTSLIEKTVKFGDYEFDWENKKLLQNGNKIQLTTNQRDLMYIFIKNIGIVMNREEIAKQLCHVNIRTIDTQITRLRSKIEKDPKNPEFLQTVRNQGYVLWA